MIDILNQRVKMSPEKQFIQYDNQYISYNQFNNIVNNVSSAIKLADLKNHYIGLQIIDKLKLLVVIVAMNRHNKIPILYPDYPNIQDYLKNTNIPIAFKDDDIAIDTSNSNGDTKKKYDPDATQVVVFTSGTTGLPKACRLTYQNIYQSALQWNKILKFDDDDIYLNHMPIIHVSGLSIFFRALYYDFKMMLTDFNVNNYFNYIKDNRITLVSMVPGMLKKATKDTSVSNISNNLKAMIISGSEINPEHFDIITKYQIPAYIAYGMSETASGIAGFWYNCNQKKRYVPHDNINIKLYGSKIMITSDTVMKGYFNEQNLKKTFISSDIGKIYSNQSFKIKKREGSISNYGGEFISQEYIKNHIEQYAGVVQCTLKVIKDNHWGEVLHAYVKLNQSIDSDSLLNKLKKNLPRHMVPKRIILQ